MMNLPGLETDCNAFLQFENILAIASSYIIDRAENGLYYEENIMKRSSKLLSISILPTLMLAAGSLVAAPPGEPLKEMVKEKAAAKEMVKEKAAAGEQLKNAGEKSQLRHRINENDPENAKKVREEGEKQAGKKQEGKKSQHQYRYEEKAPGQHKHQSGSGMGGGMGGGGGKR